MPDTVDAGRLSEPAVTSHLERQVRLWLGAGNDVVEVPSLPAHLARRLLRLEEYEVAHRDQWDAFEHGFSESYRAGSLWEPEIDVWLATARADLGRRYALEPLWPGDSRFAVCLTHDVDMVSRQMTPAQLRRAITAAPRRAGFEPSHGGRREMATRLAKALGKAAVYGVSLAPSAAPALEACLELERRTDAPASYLFTVAPSQPTHFDCVYDLRDHCLYGGRKVRIGDVVRELSESGHDVGLHGSYRSALVPRLLEAEREQLADWSSAPVVSTRQHYLHFDIRITPRLQDSARFEVDSTLGFNRNIGFRAGTSLPFYHLDLAAGRPLDVLEVPLIVQESPLLASNALELDERLARDLVASFMDRIAAVEGVATLLFHPHSLLDPRFRALYAYCLDYARDAGAWIASLRQIGDWWRARERRVAGARGPS